MNGLWFTESHPGAIACITTAGAITEYPIGGGCYGIALGPDGNIWFTEQSANKVGRMPVP